MRYVSLFSGIECASLAWGPLGWEPVCFSEVEPFASAVLAHRFPDVPNVGDVTAHDWSSLRGRVDVVVGGPPCPSFSVAGRRGSLGDPRGRLILDYVEVVHAVDPRWAVLENVPGLLSDRGNAFGVFLARLVGADAPLVPPRECGGRWTDAGVAAGPRYLAAWRVLDAQYFGLAQRRRRVFVAAVRAGDRVHPSAVLLEPGRVRRDPPARGPTGQGASPCVTGGAPFSRPGNARAELDAVIPTLSSQGVPPGTAADAAASLVPEVANPLTARMGRGVNTTANEGQTMVAVTLKARRNHEGEDGTMIVEQEATSTLRATDQSTTGPVVAFSCKDHGVDAARDVAPTLRGMNEVDGNANGGGQVAIAFDCKAGGDTSFSVGEVPGSLRGEGSGGGHAAVVHDDPRRFGGAHRDCGEREVHPSLGTSNPSQILRQELVVRRLTPRECERLQGVRDDWTLVPYRGRTSADGPRYRALGNGFAVPVMRWIGERIEEACAGE